MIGEFKMQVSNRKDIVTARLVLIAVTPESVASEKAQDGKLGAIIGARLTGEWPPKDWEPHVFDLMLKRFAADPEDVGWGRYVALRDETGDGRVLIGTLGGFRREDECEVGYSLLPAFQRKGYATEGMRAFLAWALETEPGLQVMAQTLAGHGESVRVMEKCGMRFAGSGVEEGMVVYRL